MNKENAGAMASQEFLPRFAPTFLDDHARRIIRDPAIALVEVVANCWDAGADRVDITWPEESAPDPIGIKDNGVGMTYDQFTERWRQLNYDRRQSQGDEVEFPPDNRSSHRKAFGRNGKGRHSMFCFANEYFVETWRDGAMNRFRIDRSSATTAAPYLITHEQRSHKEGHGTIVSATLVRNALRISAVRDLIGSKFVTDPTFEVYLNDNPIELMNLEHLLDVQTVDVPGYGEVIVRQIDTQKTSRTSHPHGVAWWVNKRLVGEPSWKEFDDTGFLDRRTIEARRFTFVVEADILADDVEDDWSGFRYTESYRAVHSAVQNHIRRKMVRLLKDVHTARKKEVISANSKDLSSLPSDSRYYIGYIVDRLQERMPSIRQEILCATVNVLSKMEKTRTGYDLIQQLAGPDPCELDQLSEILDNWSVHEARIVLGELERRLGVIKALEALVDNPSSDELHDIQPLFQRGLWMFGPEYESVQFTSNQTLLTVVRDLLKDRLETPLSNPRRRPDFVVLPDSTIGIYASDSFDERAEVNGIDKVLIVELKRGGTRIGLEDRRQGENYALELRNSGKVQDFTQMLVLVLGTEVDQDVREQLTVGNITILARPYGTVLQQAHARTFHLLQKIKEAKRDDLLDPDVEEVLAEPTQAKMFPEKVQ